MFKSLSHVFLRPSYALEHKKDVDPENVRDFMDLCILELQRTKDPRSSFYGKTGEFGVIGDLMDLFLAGMETTASSLLWTFLYLLHFPTVQTRVHEELDQVNGKKITSILNYTGLKMLAITRELGTNFEADPRTTALLLGGWQI